MQFKSVFIRSALMACLLCFTTPNLSHAAILFSVDGDSMTPGIQSTGVATVGSDFVANLFLSGTGTDSVISYNISLRYNPNQFQLISRNEQVPPTWVDPDPQQLSATPGDGNAYILRINAEDQAGTGLAAPFGPVSLGSFTFRPLLAGDALIEVGLFENPPLFATDADAVINSNFDDASSTFVGQSATITSIAAVPEPTSIGLLAVGAVAFWWRRRSRI